MAAYIVTTGDFLKFINKSKEEVTTEMLNNRFGTSATSQFIYECKKKGFIIKYKTNWYVTKLGYKEISEWRKRKNVNTERKDS